MVMVLIRIVVIIQLLALAGCGWVDSKGVQESEGQILLDQGLVIPLTESVQRSLDPGRNIDPDNSVVAWRWGSNYIQAGSLPSCRGVDGFNESYAADTMAEACVKSDDCRIYFEPQTVRDDLGERTVFSIVPPKLRAPIGLSYQLTGTEADGSEEVYNFTYCLIAVNEAPVAENDVFTVLSDGALELGSNDVNLLSNDIDDVDASNQPLRVLQVLQEPSFASAFEVREDGGFTYVPVPPGPRESSERTDSFVYEISDGYFTSSATALINIVTSDLPPVLTDDLPVINAIVGIDIEHDFADYFTDPEGSDLGFSIISGSVPRNNRFVISQSGLFSGSAAVADVGSWQVGLVVTDNTHQINEQFQLEIIDNEPPEGSAMPSLAVDEGESFELSVARYFTDPENQPLEYTLLDADNATVAIDPIDGVLSGLFLTEGDYTLTLSVGDGVNAAIRSTIDVAVAGIPNRTPLYTGTLPNFTFEVGSPIDPIEGNFVDPDNDPLVYTLVGTLPSGLSLSRTTGQISGTPTQTGQFRNLRITATDPDNEAVSSDTFTVTVTAVQVNQPPDYSGSLANQTVTLGETITPVRGSFVDPDGDLLTYELVGTLLPGLEFTNDGVVAGTPTQIGSTTSLYIVATDPDGLAAQSDAFRITVLASVSGTTNRQPTYSGAIANQSVDLGEAITPISGNFDDPDNDTLVYSVTGTLPPGVSISAVTGTVSGTPTSAGSYGPLRIRATDPDGLYASSDTFTLVVNAPVIGAAKTEANSLLSFEAEDFDSRAGGDGHQWQTVSNVAASGGQMLTATPDTGANHRNLSSTTPVANYEVNFSSAGTTYIWVRGYGKSKGNTLHIGINGEKTNRSSNIELDDGWSWTNEAQSGQARITVPTSGAHTINLWMREDGTSVDKLVFARSPNYAPSGADD